MKADFQEVLLSRLAEALAQREEMMRAPKEWVSREAKKRQALQEAGTLRYSSACDPFWCESSSCIVSFRFRSRSR